MPFDSQSSKNHYHNNFPMSSALCLFPQFHLVELRKINLRRHQRRGEIYHISIKTPNVLSSLSLFADLNTHFAFICNQSLSLLWDDENKEALKDRSVCYAIFFFTSVFYYSVVHSFSSLFLPSFSRRLVYFPPRHHQFWHQ